MPSTSARCPRPTPRAPWRRPRPGWPSSSESLSPSRWPTPFGSLRAVERAEILCTVGCQWRYLAAAASAREMLADQPIAVVRGWWCHTIPLVESLRDRRNSGGQIADARAVGAFVDRSLW